MSVEADPIEFNAVGHLRVDAFPDGTEEDSPVQICLVGDDGVSLNINMSHYTCAMLCRELNEM